MFTPLLRLLLCLAVPAAILLPARLVASYGGPAPTIVAAASVPTDR